MKCVSLQLVKFNQLKGPNYKDLDRHHIYSVQQLTLLLLSFCFIISVPELFFYHIYEKFYFLYRLYLFQHVCSFLCIHMNGQVLTYIWMRSICSTHFLLQDTGLWSCDSCHIIDIYFLVISISSYVLQMSLPLLVLHQVSHRFCPNST